MWIFDYTINYRNFYGKNVIIYFKNKNIYQHKDKVMGKLLTITYPIKEGTSSIEIIHHQDFNNNSMITDIYKMRPTHIITSDLIKKIEIDITKQTHYNFYLVKKLIEKKTNKDIVEVEIFKFLETDSTNINLKRNIQY
tara:strand:+ start:1062 stop:1475 length:414 start_codon:yes stop_codon:yes gene_type:complete